MIVSNPKKYISMPVLFRVLCINANDTQYLRRKTYQVIDTKTNHYLIRFNSGAAKWYTKDRFKKIGVI